MREPPPDVADDDVLAVARAQWSPDVDRVEHLPVGFGAHHWAAYAGPEPRLFVTLDHFGARHDAVSLEGAYAAAAVLAGRGLDFVVPTLPTATGARTLPLTDGALSATGWVDGARPTDASGALELVRRLHASEPPTGIPEWGPLVPRSFATELAERLATPWSRGPHAEDAHAALTQRVDVIADWTQRYHRLGEIARTRTWVPTHGEPHRFNLLQTESGLQLVDWESLKVAPAERDLRVLDGPDTPDPDRDMVELFDLEWRLDEIAQYSAWFEGPHGDTDDDRTALDGLRVELDRP